MRQLGDAYVKSEFRLHKNVTNQGQIALFLKEWRGYLVNIEASGRTREARSVGIIEGQVGAKKPRSTTLHEFGVDMPSDVDLSEDQRMQLQKMKLEAQKAASLRPNNNSLGRTGKM